MEGYQEWYDAFWFLSSERHIGFASGPIPILSIESWADRYVDPGERSLFRRLVLKMDTTFLEWCAEKTQKPEDTVVADQPMTPALFKAMFGGKT